MNSTTGTMDFYMAAPQSFVFYASVCIQFSGCPYICLTRYLSNAIMELLKIWHKHSLGLKDELMRFWWSKVKGQGHGDFINMVLAL